MKPSTKKMLKGWAKAALIALLMAILTSLGVTLTSCNVTRTITTEAHSIQRGDTTVHITTKTIESYNAVKNNQL